MEFVIAKGNAAWLEILDTFGWTSKLLEYIGSETLLSS